MNRLKENGSGEAYQSWNSDQAAAKWSALDQKIMGMYIAIPFYYDKMALVKGTNVGATQGDATVGMPFFQNMYLKS